MKLIHQHFLAKVNTNFFFKSPEEMNDFLRRLVKEVNMDIIIEPRSAFCGQEGNYGLTGQIGLVTSHASIHSWDEFGFHELDVYSCKYFDIEKLLDFLHLELKADSVEYLCFDRETMKRTLRVF
jgi:S-adenosylmethionine/arginine decarboxylase-like enzyme